MFRLHTLPAPIGSDKKQDFVSMDSGSIVRACYGTGHRGISGQLEVEIWQAKTVYDRRCDYCLDGFARAGLDYGDSGLLHPGVRTGKRVSPGTKRMANAVQQRRLLTITLAVFSIYLVDFAINASKT